MRTLNVACDRCGRRIEEGGSTLNASAGPLHVDRLAPFDLCRDCARRFLAWLNGDAGDASIDEPGPAGKK